MHVMGLTLTPPPPDPFCRAAQPRLFPRVGSNDAEAAE